MGALGSVCIGLTVLGGGPNTVRTGAGGSQAAAACVSGSRRVRTGTLGNAQATSGRGQSTRLVIFSGSAGQTVTVDGEALRLLSAQNRPWRGRARTSAEAGELLFRCAGGSAAAAAVSDCGTLSLMSAFGTGAQRDESSGRGGLLMPSGGAASGECSAGGDALRLVSGSCGAEQNAGSAGDCVRVLRRRGESAQQAEGTGSTGLWLALTGISGEEATGIAAGRRIRTGQGEFSSDSRGQGNAAALRAACGSAAAGSFGAGSFCRALRTWSGIPAETAGIGGAGMTMPLSCGIENPASSLCEAVIMIDGRGVQTGVGMEEPVAVVSVPAAGYVVSVSAFCEEPRGIVVPIPGAPVLPVI